MMPSTTELFELFYRVGLLKHNDLVTTSTLMDEMLILDTLRYGQAQDYLEHNIYDDSTGQLTAHGSAEPLPNSDVWIIQHHCSSVPGQGIQVMLPMMEKLVSNPSVKYILGIYNPHNPRASNIWETAKALMDNKDICDTNSFWCATDGIIRSNSYPTKSRLFEVAFGHTIPPICKFQHLFARPAGTIPATGRPYKGILFKVCAEGKKKFRQLYKGE